MSTEKPTKIGVPKDLRKTLEVDFPPRDVMMEDGRVLMVSCGTPAPMHAVHLRVGQCLQIKSRHDCHVLKYDEAKKAMALPDTAETMDPAMYSTIMEWLAAVERAAPYTLAELAYDIDAQQIASLLGMGLTGLAARLRGRTKWPVSDVYRLKLQFPQLDLEATCREIYLREFWAEQATGREAKDAH